MSKLEIVTDESKIDWLWASLQVTSNISLLHSELLGDPFESLVLAARNNGGNLELVALYRLQKSLQDILQDNKLPLPQQFLRRYMRTRPRRAGETLLSDVKEETRDGKIIVTEPAYKITDGTILLPRDTKRPDEMAFSIKPVVMQGQNRQEYGIVVTQGSDGTESISLTTRSELESRIGQMHGLLASLTTSLWEDASKSNNGLKIEWQFPATIPPQVRTQVLGRYISSPEIIGRKHRTKEFVLEWESVGGLLKPKRTLEGAIVDIENPALSYRAAMSPYGEKIFLVSGYSETGKTSLVRAFATRLQRSLQKRGFTYYYFDCSSAIAEYGVLTGEALTSVIKAAQDDVRQRRTALVYIDKLDALLQLPLSGDTNQNRFEMMQAVQRLKDVRDAVRAVYDFHTRTTNVFLTEFQANAKRAGQLRHYEKEHQRGITEEEKKELVSLMQKLKELKEQDRQPEEQRKLEGKQLGKEEQDRLRAKFNLPEPERSRLLELRYIMHGISRTEQEELKGLSEELGRPYFPTLVVIGESTMPRSELGILSDVFRREVKVYNDKPDREGIFRTLIGAAQYTLGRSRNPGVKFDDINYEELARATDGMTAGQIKEMHLYVMTQAKLQLNDTGQSQIISTTTYLEGIRGERESLAQAGQLNKSIGFHTLYSR